MRNYALVDKRAKAVQAAGPERLQFAAGLCPFVVIFNGIYEASPGRHRRRPEIIFGAAIKANASAVVLAHNHPSGNLTPSQADIKLTKDMVAAGKFLHIPVLDHVIMTSESFLSFAEEGLL